ncbi:hypothetical protein HC928_02110 [bacterium]|nr:hypothetical protein [bacterium]
MTIYHDVYFFDPGVFAESIRKYSTVRTGEVSVEYDLLRQDAIQAFEASSKVRNMADEYGGWDMQGILSQPTRKPRSATDVAFWLILLLYKHLSDVETTPVQGLGSQWAQTVDVLQRGDWAIQDARMTVLGKQFGVFATKYALDGPIQAWEHFAPFSTSSSVGWLSVDDIERLMGRLSSFTSSIYILKENYENVSILRAAFESALKQNLGLCIVISG